MDVLGPHDGAEIDKWMSGTAGKSGGGGRGRSRVDIITA